ncbi:MAG: spore germination protein GerW family protein [Chloroflexota bacterium]
MSEEIEITVNDPGQAIDMIQETIETFLETADVNRVYAEPIEHGDTIIIPAAEVVVAMGFGAGFGSGGSDEEVNGTGGGGGGGGQTFARPVAVIIASPEGVRVEPVIDPTKIALTALTAFGFIFATIAKMKKGK